MSTNSLDHRNAQSVVRDQGRRRTCAGFAVSAAHEWMAADGIIRSAEDALWAGHQQGGPEDKDETTIALALAGLARLQHASEEAWPYGTPEWRQGRPDAACDEENRRALVAWHAVPSTIDSLHDHMSQGRAVILTVHFLSRAWGTDGAVDAGPAQSSQGKHAVLAVGFQRGEDQEIDRIIIKNSWGPNWGDLGYGFMSRRYFEMYRHIAHILEPA
jgi:hypothetical protein